MQLTPSIHRGGDSIVNWYAVVDGGKVTLVDAGLPRHWSQLGTVLDGLGRSPGDVEAVLLTHAHVDHVGFADRARTELGAGVRAHAADVPVAEGAEPEQRITVGKLPLWKPAAWKFLAVMVRGGGATFATIGAVIPVADGEVLDVPGRPRVIHTPGHTPGSAAYHFAGADALFTGDTLVTMGVVGGSDGPQMLPPDFHADPEEALSSARSLASVDASIVLPGHGPAFRGTPAEATGSL